MTIKTKNNEKVLFILFICIMYNTIIIKQLDNNTHILITNYVIILIII